MILADIVRLGLAIVVYGIAGVVAHELSHFVVGFVSGGKPFISKQWLFIPHEIDYERPEELTAMQARLTGGIVYIWPVLLFALLALTNRSDFIPLTPLITFLTTASIISWFDGFACQNPEMWKDFTAGESIDRSRLE